MCYLRGVSSFDNYYKELLNQAVYAVEMIILTRQLLPHRVRRCTDLALKLEMVLDLGQPHPRQLAEFSAFRSVVVGRYSGIVWSLSASRAFAEH